VRFNQLVELTSALSEADKDTKYVLATPTSHARTSPACAAAQPSHGTIVVQQTCPVWTHNDAERRCASCCIWRNLAPSYTISKIEISTFSNLFVEVSPRGASNGPFPLFSLLFRARSRLITNFPASAIGRDKLETAEILSLLGFAGGRKNEPTRTQTTMALPTGQPAVAASSPAVRVASQQLPLPAIQHIAPAPAGATTAVQQTQQPRQQQQAIRPAVAKLPIRMSKPTAVPVLPATTAAAAKNTTTAPANKPSARSATQGVEGEKKRKRSKTTPDQLRILMDEFQREPMPNATTRQTLAARLDMTPRSVQIWFQNMRAKVKKANSGSAPGDEKKSTNASPALTDAESDGPAKKRQRVVTGEEESDDKMAIEQPQSRRNSITGPAPAMPVAIPATVTAKPTTAVTPQPSATTAAKPQQAVKIAASPQSAFVPANATSSSSKPRSAEQQPVAGKLPLPVIQHHHLGQAIFGVPLQYMPQSYHCDQLKRATMAALSGSVQQMTA
jgi:hypothetical protein